MEKQESNTEKKNEKFDEIKIKIKIEAKWELGIYHKLCPRIQVSHLVDACRRIG